MSVRVIHGDMREQLRALIAAGVRVQSIVTDAPYGLAFMGKAWDQADNIAFRPETWRLCYELLPPGGHLLAFGGTRCFHRLVCAIEDAGFEIRDTIAWLYGSGFPKSHNVSKGIDRAAGEQREVIGFDADKYRPNRDKHLLAGQPGGGGKLKADNGATITAPATDAARQWDGWGTALKPAMELICVARKPLIGTVAANVLATGTGALNIDGCRIATDEDRRRNAAGGDNGLVASSTFQIRERRADDMPETSGRWPANVVHDGSAEVVKAFPDTSAAGHFPQNTGGIGTDSGIFGKGNGRDQQERWTDGSGSTARFFYSAKADSDDRLGSKHPTVKPVDLMRWLVRLVTPPGGTCLDPFAGSGTTGMACMAEGFDCILVERELEYVKDIQARIAHVRGEDTPLFAALRAGYSATGEG